MPANGGMVRSHKDTLPSKPMLYRSSNDPNLQMIYKAEAGKKINVDPNDTEKKRI
jgi:hypothetical protein